MKSLTELYTSATIKTFLAKSNTDYTCMVEKQLENDFYLCKPLIIRDLGYVSDNSYIVLNGSEQIWEFITQS